MDDYRSLTEEELKEFIRLERFKSQKSLFYFARAILGFRKLTPHLAQSMRFYSRSSIQTQASSSSQGALQEHDCDYSLSPLAPHSRRYTNALCEWEPR